MSERLQGKNVGEIRALARADAQKSLQSYWGAAVPVEPISIARSMGVGVFSAQLGTDTWGMLVGTGGGADIYLDKDQPRSRFRFSCAHEVGHYVDRGEEIAAGKAVMDRRSEAGRGTADEIYANEFAAALLMPEPTFRAIVEGGGSVEDVTRTFDVSRDAATLRAKHLGLSFQ